MKTAIKAAMLVMLAGWTIPAAAQQPAPREQSTPAVTAAVTQDNMTPYRKVAADALQAFKARDLGTAKTKARELEVAWDTGEKALKKRSPDVWGQIDRAMDVFIKPLEGKSADPAKVQAAYDAYIAKLQLAVTTGEESRR